MNLIVTVLPLPPQGAHSFRPTAEERKFLLPSQPVDRSIGELFPILEERIKDQYLSGYDLASFTIKVIRDAYDCDLTPDLSLDVIFGKSPPPYHIKVVSARIEREVSLPITSTLRPQGATPFKRPLPPTFQVAEENDRRRLGQEQRTRDLLAYVDPDQPLQSSEKDEIEDDEEADQQRVAAVPQLTRTSLQRNYAGRRFSDAVEIDDSEVDTAERRRSDTHRRPDSTVEDADDEEPQIRRQSKSRRAYEERIKNVHPRDAWLLNQSRLRDHEFAKPSLPASRGRLERREDSIELGARQNGSPSVYPPDVLDHDGRLMQMDTNKPHPSKRRRTSRDVFDIPMTEDEQAVDARRLSRSVRSSNERSESYGRSAPSLQHRKRDTNSPLITPDSSQIGRQLVYDANGQRVKPLTTITNSRREFASGDGRKSHLRLDNEEQPQNHESPIFAGGLESDIELEPQGEPNRPSEAIESDEIDGTRVAPPPTVNGLPASGLRTPFVSFSAKEQQAENVATSSQRPKKKKARQPQTNVSATAEAHQRLQSATTNPSAIARDSSTELPMVSPHKVKRDQSSTSGRLVNPAVVINVDANGRSVHHTPSPPTDLVSTTQVVVSSQPTPPRWLKPALHADQPSQSTQKVTQTPNTSMAMPHKATLAKAPINEDESAENSPKRLSRQAVGANSPDRRSQDLLGRQQSGARHSGGIQTQTPLSESSSAAIPFGSRRIAKAAFDAAVAHHERQLLAKKTKDREVEHAARSRESEKQAEMEKEKIRRINQGQTSRSEEIDRLPEASGKKQSTKTKDAERGRKNFAAAAAPEHITKERNELDNTMQTQFGEEQLDKRNARAEKATAEEWQKRRNEAAERKEQAPMRKREETEKAHVGKARDEEAHVQEQIRTELNVSTNKKKKPSEENFGWLEHMTPPGPSAKKKSAPHSNLLSDRAKTLEPEIVHAIPMSASRAKSLAPTQSSGNEPESSKSRSATEQSSKKDLKRKRPSEPSDWNLHGKQMKLTELDLTRKGKRPVIAPQSYDQQMDTIIVPDTDSEVQFIGAKPGKTNGPPKTAMAPKTPQQSSNRVNPTTSTAKQIKTESSSARMKSTAKSQVRKSCWTCYKRKRKCERDENNPSGPCVTCSERGNACLNDEPSSTDDLKLQKLNPQKAVSSSKPRSEATTRPGLGNHAQGPYEVSASPSIPSIQSSGPSTTSNAAFFNIMPQRGRLHQSTATTGEIAPPSSKTGPSQLTSNSTKRSMEQPMSSYPPASSFPFPSSQMPSSPPVVWFPTPTTEADGNGHKQSALPTAKSFAPPSIAESKLQGLQSEDSSDSASESESEIGSESDSESDSDEKSDDIDTTANTKHNARAGRAQDGGNSDSEDSDEEMVDDQVEEEPEQESEEMVKRRFAAAMSAPLIGRDMPPTSNFTNAATSGPSAANASTDREDDSDSDSDGVSSHDSDVLTPKQQARIDAAPLAKQSKLRQNFLGRFGQFLGNTVFASAVPQKERQREWHDVSDVSDEE